MRKGEMTRSAILDTALELASRDGLEGLTIGLLAEKMKMSKSGVFAHFGSREDLQIEVLKRYRHRFEQEVFYPSLQEVRGVARLRSMFSLWINRLSIEIASGCIFISGAVEYDDRPGAIRDALSEMVHAWRDALVRCVEQAIQTGELRQDADVQQIVYELYGLVLALHHDARFIKSAGVLDRAHVGFERLIAAYASEPPSPQRRKPDSSTEKSIHTL